MVAGGWGGWKAVFLPAISLVITCSGGAVTGVLPIDTVGAVSDFRSARMPSCFPYSIINALRVERRGQQLKNCEKKKGRKKRKETMY